MNEVPNVPIHHEAMSQPREQDCDNQEEETLLSLPIVQDRVCVRVSVCGREGEECAYVVSVW